MSILWFLYIEQIFSTFLHSEYGGPGTLLVLPFIDMADTVNERGLPGGPQAARAAIKWAQKHVDNDWKEWTAPDSNWYMKTPLFCILVLTTEVSGGNL